MFENTQLVFANSESYTAQFSINRLDNEDEVFFRCAVEYLKTSDSETECVAMIALNNTHCCIGSALDEIKSLLNTPFVGAYYRDLCVSYDGDEVWYDFREQSDTEIISHYESLYQENSESEYATILPLHKNSQYH